MKRKKLLSFLLAIALMMQSGAALATDIDIEAKQMLRVKERLNSILASNTGHSLSEIEKDTDRNNWMFAEDALKYGIIDKIIE